MMTDSELNAMTARAEKVLHKYAPDYAVQDVCDDDVPRLVEEIRKFERLRGELQGYLLRALEDLTAPMAGDPYVSLRRAEKQVAKALKALGYENAD